MNKVIMKLSNLIARKAPNRLFFSIVLGAIAGISYAILIPVILASIDSGFDTVMVPETLTFLSIEIANYKFALLFLISCLVILFARTISQVLLIQVAEEVTTDIRLHIYRVVLRTPMEVLESFGPSKLLAVVTEDVDRVVNGAITFPSILVNSVTLLGMLGFLCYLNFEVFIFVLGAILFGMITYQVPMYIGRRFFEKGRYYIDVLFESTRGLIYGVKELKLNKRKREVYYAEFLEKNEYAFQKANRQGEIIVRSAVNYGDMISFFVIGVVSFVFVNYSAISTGTLVGVIMALLYITGPISALMNSIPALIGAKISLRRVNDFVRQLPEEEASESVSQLPDWKEIFFRDVTYNYKDEMDSPGFKLGPINLSISKGEITFIVGGNGSGKSTFCKLISLHYSLSKGEIYFGSTKVEPGTLNSCRECVSAIFTDFYLFDRLLGVVEDDQLALVDGYLKLLKIDHKVKIENGFFSTLALSDGQRKRLALLVEFLEDRDVYIFDEWAADQDPAFKKIFYYSLLPLLKEKGKAVIVISHDDRYFGIADKIISVKEGEVSIETEIKISDKKLMPA